MKNSLENPKPPTDGEMSASALVWLAGFGILIVLVAQTLNQVHP